MHQSSYRALPWVLWKWSFIPLSALRLPRCPTGCSTAGISPEIHQRFASPFLLPSPSPETAAPSLCTTENVGRDGMGSKQANPSVWEAAGTTVDNPRHSLSGSTSCSCFCGWGEPRPMGSVMFLSNSLHAQDKSISIWYHQTQTESDAASTANAFFGDQAEILGALCHSG